MGIFAPALLLFQTPGERLRKLAPRVAFARPAAGSEEARKRGGSPARPIAIR
jgi:hypothetical protein